MNNCLIRQKSSIKYLGCIINETLTPSDHVDYIYEKAIETFHTLCSISSKQWRIGSHAAKIIYTGAIEPILTYALPAWGNNL